MFLGNAKKLVLGSLIAVVTLSLAAPQADAFWHRRWGSSGGWYCSGSSGSSGYYSSGSSGSSGGYYYGYYSSGGCSSSGGSSGSSGGWYSSGGSWGSSGGSSGGYSVQSVPAAPMVPTTPPAPGTTTPPTLESTPMPGADAAPSTMNGTAARAATLAVHVPADAKVYVNGLLTKSTGNDRRYVSNGLRPGFNYTYELRAQTERDGRVIEESKVVQLQAGQSADVNFGLNGSEQVEERTATKPVIKTSLKLHVPADAKVFLSGNESKSTGTTREFVTTQLNDGQSWDNYVVRVELERNGQKISKTEKLSLAAGDSRELTIDMGNEQVAQASTDGDRQ